jgi:pantoate--beta-alanine ligase
MLIYTKIADIQAFLNAKRNSGQQIGFVPTMGALHQGHISLIKQAQQQGNLTICSIFVNPTQFNDKSDLERYPRTPEKDSALLEAANCDVLFMPGVEEMYPKEGKPNFDFGYLDKILEGAHRQGHFNGVAQVVKRFFEILTPHQAFFGSKDYQQVLIVKALVKQMSSPIDIVSCPILREPDGLAMSSRNVLLSPAERLIAGTIPKLMAEAKKRIHIYGIANAKDYVKQTCEAIPQIKLDYYDVCHPDTLISYADTEKPDYAIALIALFVGKIRLIDNL